jgi:hypothetical protein
LKVYLSVFILVLSVFTSLSTHAEESRPPNHKFEDLFIWKVSDELKLSVPEEKSFSDLIRSLNQKKASLSDQIQDTLKKIAAGGTAPEMATGKSSVHKKSMDKILNEYRSELKALNNLNVEEIDQVKKILGSEKAAQYLVLKNDLANQLRSKLLNSDADKSKTDLPTPKIIEEQ